MKGIFLYISLCFICSPGWTQSLTADQYIDMYKDMAIREMKRMGVPASIILAQGILETESGNSQLVKKSNNHFGIKCKSTWSGESVSHDDDANGECFRKYASADDSYRDHSNFLRGSNRYAFLFKLQPTDYKGWAYGLKKAGYATNPAYPKILIKSIEEHNLQQYTLMGLGDVPVFETTKYTDDKEESQKFIQENNTGIDSASTGGLTGKTQFNGLKAVYANSGTSLLAIATNHHIALSKLLEYNDLNEDGLLKEDTWIYLEKKLTKGNRDFYIAEKEETMAHIAQVNGIQLSYLIKYNELPENDLVKPGTRIYLRPGVPEQAGTASRPNTITHIVQPKEGLYAISKKYNVSVQDIRDWNQLKSDELQIGQKLIISK